MSKLTIYFPKAMPRPAMVRWMTRRPDLIPFEFSHWCDECEEYHVMTSDDLGEHLARMLLISTIQDILSPKQNPNRNN